MNALLLVAPLLLSSPSDDACQVAGRWVGIATINRHPRVIHVSITEQEGRLHGLMDIPFAGPTSIRGRRLEELVCDDDLVEFTVDTGDYGTLEIHGWLDVDEMAGSSIGPGGRRPFHLVRTAGIDPVTLTSACGLYEDGDDRWLLALDPYGGLLAVSLSRDDSTNLLPRGSDAFVAWDGALPPRASVVLDRDANGDVTGIAWTDAGSETPRRIARVDAPPFDVEEVRFGGAGPALAGSLLRPRRDSTTPAILLIAGSGHGTRNSASLQRLGATLAERGFAVLLTDKRGCGLSDGDWMTASPHDLAADAAEAIAFLRARDEIDGDRVGAYGFSQGGWLLPLVAHVAPDVAFLINDSGGAHSLAEADLFYSESIFRRNGFTGAELEEAMAFCRLRHEALGDPDGWPRFVDAVESARGARWFDVAGFTGTDPDHPMVRTATRMFTLDPEPYWAEVQVPVLVLYGDADENVPVARASERLRALGAGRDWTIRVFEGAGHGCRMIDGSGRRAPGYLQTLLAWLEAHTDARGARPNR